MTPKRCEECGGRWDEKWKMYRCTFVCSKNPLREARRIKPRRYPEREQVRHELMLKRDYHAPFLTDSDACPQHNYTPWDSCPGCESIADHRSEVDV